MSKVTSTVKFIDTKRDDDGWEHNLYEVTLRYKGRKMTTSYRMGMALTEEPTTEEVLHSLVRDAEGVEFESFEDWAADYGYDVDSRKAERIYKACEQIGKRLHKFLGDDFEAIARSVADL